MPANGNPHAGQPVYTAGAKLDSATSAFILLHGRGAPAEDILSLSSYFDWGGIIFLAPQAANYTWWPNRFMDPLEQNEPFLSSALTVVDEVVKKVGAQGMKPERVFIGGFSQGACLACEYVLRHPRRYGGLFVFSGGFVGPLDIQREPNGDLASTPAFLGCSDVDPHIPLKRVKETTSLLRAMNADVTEKIYPAMGHTIIEDEIEEAKNLVQKSLVERPGG